jgi:hypothetical protein
MGFGAQDVGVQGFKSKVYGSGFRCQGLDVGI